MPRSFCALVSSPLQGRTPPAYPCFPQGAFRMNRSQQTLQGLSPPTPPPLSPPIPRCQSHSRNKWLVGWAGPCVGVGPIGHGDWDSANTEQLILGISCVRFPQGSAGAVRLQCALIRGDVCRIALRPPQLVPSWEPNPAVGRSRKPIASSRHRPQCWVSSRTWKQQEHSQDMGRVLSDLQVLSRWLVSISAYCTLITLSN